MLRVCDMHTCIVCKMAQDIGIALDFVQKTFLWLVLVVFF